MLVKPLQEYKKEKSDDLYKKLRWLFSVKGVKQYKQNNRNEYLQGKLLISSFLPHDITTELPRQLDDLQLSPDFYFPGGLELCKDKFKDTISNTERLKHLPRERRPPSVHHLFTAISKFQDNFIQCWRVISRLLDEDLDVEFTETEELPWFSNNEIKQQLNYLIVKIAWGETARHWNKLGNGIMWDCPTSSIKKDFIDILCPLRSDGIPDSIVLFKDLLDSITASESPAFGEFHSTNVSVDDVSQMPTDDEQASFQANPGDDGPGEGTLTDQTMTDVMGHNSHPQQQQPQDPPTTSQAIVSREPILIQPRPQQQQPQGLPPTYQASVPRELVLLQAMQQQQQLHTTAHGDDGPGEGTLTDQTMTDVMGHNSHPQQQQPRDPPTTSQAIVSRELVLLHAMQQQQQTQDVPPTFEANVSRERVQQPQDVPPTSQAIVSRELVLLLLKRKKLGNAESQYYGNCDMAKFESRIFSVLPDYKT